MEDRLTKDERMYAFCRLLVLVTLAALVYSNILKLPLDKLSFAVLAVVWISLSTALLFWLRMFSPSIIFMQHVADLAILGIIVVFNGGRDCAFAYMLPLYVVTTAVLVGRGWAAFIAAAVATFVIYLVHDAQSNLLIHTAFWVAYCAGILSFSFFLTAIREIRHYKLLYQETEKREKHLERALTKIEEKATAQSIVDEATGLKNFRYFRERLETEIKRAARQKYIFSLCMMSVDGLEEFTTRNGPGERDLALGTVTRQLIKSLRDTDLVCRYQPNQFLFLLPDTDARKAIIPAKRIRDKLLNTGFGKMSMERFNFSFGIAGFPADAQALGGLISLASASLQRSHQRGNSQITIASSVTKTLT